MLQKRRYSIAFSCTKRPKLNDVNVSLLLLLILHPTLTDVYCIPCVTIEFVDWQTMVQGSVL